MNALLRESGYVNLTKIFQCDLHDETNLPNNLQIKETGYGTPKLPLSRRFLRKLSVLVEQETQSYLINSFSQRAPFDWVSLNKIKLIITKVNTTRDQFRVQRKFISGAEASETRVNWVAMFQSYIWLIEGKAQVFLMYQLRSESKISEASNCVRHSLKTAPEVLNDKHCYLKSPQIGVCLSWFLTISLVRTCGSKYRLNNLTYLILYLSVHFLHHKFWFRMPK